MQTICTNGTMVSAGPGQESSYAEWRATLLPKESEPNSRSHGELASRDGPLLVRRKSESSSVRESSYANWRESLRRSIMAKSAEDSGSGSEGTHESHESFGNTSTATPLGSAELSDSGSASLEGSIKLDSDGNTTPDLYSPDSVRDKDGSCVPHMFERTREQERNIVLERELELVRERKRELLMERDRAYQFSRAGVSPIRRVLQR